PEFCFRARDFLLGRFPQERMQRAALSCSLPAYHPEFCFRARDFLLDGFIATQIAPAFEQPDAVAQIVHNPVEYVSPYHAITFRNGFRVSCPVEMVGYCLAD